LVRVVHYLPFIRLELGGVVRAVLDFCRVLAEHGHPTTLVCADRRDVPADWPHHPGGDPRLPRVVVLEPQTGVVRRLTPRAQSQLAGALRDADVLHLHAMWEPTNVQAAKVARRAAKPYVLSPHGMLDDWSMAQSRLKKRLFLALKGNRLLRNAARVHCTAQGELDQAQKWLPAGKGVVLPLIFDLSPFQTAPGPALARQAFAPLREAPRDMPVLLFLSRVHPKKGLDALIDAAAELQRRGRPALLLIAGPGDEPYVESLRQRADRLGVGERVHFLGMVRGQEKVSLYQAADLFVLPTSQENFGLVLLEAMASGTPVVTTKGVDIWPELQRAGAIITDQSPTELAAAIEASLKSPTRKTIGEQGRQWVFQQFAPPRLVEQYAALYSSLNPEP
jgi:glycosyltransferase involved in cell wall biosynthesis